MLFGFNFLTLSCKIYVHFISKRANEPHFILILLSPRNVVLNNMKEAFIFMFIRSLCPSYLLKFKFSFASQYIARHCG